MDEPWYLEYDDVDAYPSWGEKGLCVHIESADREGPYVLNQLIEQEFDNLKEKYGKNSIVIEQGPYDLTRITIKISDRPFKNFTYASKDQRHEYIDELKSAHCYFIEFLNDAIENIHNNEQRAA